MHCRDARTHIISCDAEILVSRNLDDALECGDLLPRWWCGIVLSFRCAKRWPTSRGKNALAFRVYFWDSADPRRPATACTHKMAIGDSDLIKVRFAPLC